MHTLLACISTAFALVAIGAAFFAELERRRCDAHATRLARDRQRLQVLAQNDAALARELEALRAWVQRIQGKVSVGKRGADEEKVARAHEAIGQEYPPAPTTPLQCQCGWCDACAARLGKLPRNDGHPGILTPTERAAVAELER